MSQQIEITYYGKTGGPIPNVEGHPQMLSPCVPRVGDHIQLEGISFGPTGRILHEFAVVKVLWRYKPVGTVTVNDKYSWIYADVFVA